MLGEISSPPQNPGNLLLPKRVCGRYSLRLTSLREETRHLLHTVCSSLPLFLLSVLSAKQTASLPACLATHAECALLQVSGKVPSFCGNRLRLNVLLLHFGVGNFLQRIAEKDKQLGGETINLIRWCQRNKILSYTVKTYIPIGFTKVMCRKKGF